MTRRIGWDAWRALRARTHLVFAIVDLPTILGGAVLWPRGDRGVLLVDRSAGRRRRHTAVAHELTHEDLPGASEEQVRDEVARRLVPFDHLAAMYELAVANELTVEPWQVADHFDVEDDVAERAMRMFLGR